MPMRMPSTMRLDRTGGVLRGSWKNKALYLYKAIWKPPSVDSTSMIGETLFRTNWSHKNHMDCQLATKIGRIIFKTFVNFSISKLTSHEINLHWSNSKVFKMWALLLFNILMYILADPRNFIYISFNHVGFLLV